MRIKTYQEFLNEHNSEDLKANEEFSVDLESGDVLGKEGEVKFYHVDAENEERDCTLQAMLDTAAKLVDKDVTPRGLWGDVEDKNTFSLSYEFTTPDKELEDTTEGGHGYILKINFPKKRLEELIRKMSHSFSLRVLRNLKGSIVGIPATSEMGQLFYFIVHDAFDQSSQHCLLN